MVDGLGSSIFPELADVAIVLGCKLAAVDADVRGFLGRPAQHAQHVPRLVPDHLMILAAIMAKGAGIPLLARGTFRLDITLVMLAAQRWLRVQRGIRVTRRLNSRIAYEALCASNWCKGGRNVAFREDKLLGGGRLTELVLPKLEGLQGALCGGLLPALGY